MLLVLTEPGPRHLPPSSHISPLLATIFGPSPSVNWLYQLFVVVQGLRDFQVAQFGRIVAGFRNYKSMTYVDFLYKTLISGRQTATVLVFRVFAGAERKAGTAVELHLAG